jgi:hypothetical protein
MPPAPSRLGDPLDGTVQIFRAFAEKSFRNRKKNQVRYFAYLLREVDSADGLSVGLTPAAAVKYLESNEGYCRISVAEIHALPYGLKVRIDLDDAEHAFICNLPLETTSDASRENARLIGGELARKSEVITCDPYIVPIVSAGPER